MPPGDRDLENDPNGDHSAPKPDAPSVRDTPRNDADTGEPAETLSVTARLPNSIVARDGSTIPNNRKFGHYKLLEEIARGGMGVVYKARHIKLNRTVALKMILSGQSADSTEVQRFHAEAEAAANLEHSGIVPIFEVGEHDGRHFFTMAFVDGQSLAQLIRQKPLGCQHAAAIMADVADAIVFAHERGVIHRDLKPGNVLIDANGKPKVTDFGLAKRTDTDSELTGTGQVLGTPSFMAPEQAAGKTDEIGPLSDVYALGATLYCLVTGRPPFYSATVIDTLLAVVNQQPVSPRNLNSTIGKDLETICLKCLEKEPSARYPSAQVVQQELKRYLAGEPIHARPISSTARMLRWCRRNTAIASLLMLVALSLVSGAGGSLYLASQWRDEATNARRQTSRANRATARANIARDTAQNERDAAKAARQRESEALERESEARRTAERKIAENYLDRGLKLCDEGELARGLHWIAKGLKALPEQSPALDRLIRLALVARQSQLHVLEGIVQHRAVYPIACSSDGNRYAATVNERNNVVEVWDTAVGTSITPPLIHPSRVLVAKFSNDAESLFVTCDQSKRIWRWNLETGEKSGPDFELDKFAGAIDVHPHGTEIVAGDVSDQSGTAVRLDLNSGKQIGEPFEFASMIQALAYSPDGSQLALCGTDKTTQVWEIETGEKIGPTLKQLSGAHCVAISPDGSLIATGDSASVHAWEIETGVHRWQGRHDGAVVCVAFSSDGKRLVSGSTDQNARLWSVATGEWIGQPLEHGFTVGTVAFSSDNRSVFTGAYFQTKQWSIVGEEPIETIYQSNEPIRGFAFDSGKNRIAIVSGQQVVVSDGSSRSDLSKLIAHPGLAITTVFDHEGSRLLTSCDDGKARIWNVDSGEQVGNTMPQHPALPLFWTDDGKRVITAPDPHTTRIWNAETTEPIGELMDHGGMISSRSLTPDGKYLITAGERKDVVFWDVTTGEQFTGNAKLSHEIQPSAVGFSPDNQRVLGAGFHTVLVKDAASGETLHTLHHQGFHTIAGFSPDGKVIVTGGADATVRLWDANTYALIGHPVLHGGAVHNAVFSPDSTLLLTRGLDNSRFQLIDVRTATLVGWSPRLQGELSTMGFSGDGSSVLMATSNGLLQRWKTPTPYQGTPKDAENDITIWTGVEMDDDGVVEVQMLQQWNETKRARKLVGKSRQIDVTNVDDSGPGSLRAAIHLANISFGPDTIRFNIPGTGIHTIRPVVELPHIIDSVTIDGTTQDGYDGTPLIELDGSLCKNIENGLVVEVDKCAIRGLAINRFPRVGLILIGSSDSVVERNFIGIDPGGTQPRGNGRSIYAVGLHIYSGSKRTRIEGNLIAANGGNGLLLSSDCSECAVTDNLVGTDISGKKSIPNKNGGIFLEEGSRGHAIRNNTVRGIEKWSTLHVDRDINDVSENQVSN